MSIDSTTPPPPPPPTPPPHPIDGRRLDKLVNVSVVHAIDDEDEDEDDGRRASS